MGLNFKLLSKLFGTMKLFVLIPLFALVIASVVEAAPVEENSSVFSMKGNKYAKEYISKSMAELQTRYSSPCLTLLVVWGKVYPDSRYTTQQLWKGCSSHPDHYFTPKIMTAMLKYKPLYK